MANVGSGKMIAVIDIRGGKKKVTENYEHSALTHTGGDGLESLLAGSVPNLELDSFPVHVHGAYFKVDANGGDEAWRERVVTKSEQQTALPDPYHSGVSTLIGETSAPLSPIRSNLIR